MTGHDGSDGSSMSDRVFRYVVKGACGENISYGQTTGIGVILALFIDSGVPSRGHRTNMQAKNFCYMGCHSGEHTTYKLMTNLNYCGSV